MDSNPSRLNLQYIRFLKHYPLFQRGAPRQPTFLLLFFPPARVVVQCVDFSLNTAVSAIYEAVTSAVTRSFVHSFIHQFVHHTPPHCERHQIVRLCELGVSSLNSLKTLETETPRSRGSWDETLQPTRRREKTNCTDGTSFSSTRWFLTLHLNS